MFLPLPFFKMENCFYKVLLLCFEKKWFEINICAIARVQLFWLHSDFMLLLVNQHKMWQLCLYFILSAFSRFLLLAQSKKKFARCAKKSDTPSEDLSVHAAVKSGIEPWSNFFGNSQEFQSSWIALSWKVIDYFHREVTLIHARWRRQLMKKRGGLGLNEKVMRE